MVVFVTGQQWAPGDQAIKMTAIADQAIAKYTKAAPGSGLESSMEPSLGSVGEFPV